MSTALHAEISLLVISISNWLGFMLPEKVVFGWVPFNYNFPIYKKNRQKSCSKAQI
jgi:hypothetical protein